MGSNFSEQLTEITMGSTMPLQTTIMGSISGSVGAVIDFLQALTFGG